MWEQCCVFNWQRNGKEPNRLMETTLKSSALVANLHFFILMNLSVRVCLRIIENDLTLAGFQLVSVERCEKSRESWAPRNRSAVYWLTRTHEVGTKKSWKQVMHPTMWEREMKVNITWKAVIDILKPFDGREVVGFEVSAKGGESEMRFSVIISYSYDILWGKCHAQSMGWQGQDHVWGASVPKSTEGIWYIANAKHWKNDANKNFTQSWGLEWKEETKEGTEKCETS